MRLGKSLVELQCPVEHCNNLGYVGVLHIQHCFRSQEKRIGLDVIRRSLRCRHQANFQLAGNRCRYLVLDLEDVCHRPVIGIRPKVVAIIHFDQLGGDTNPVARATDRPFQDVINF